MMTNLEKRPINHLQNFRRRLQNFRRDWRVFASGRRLLVFGLFGMLGRAIWTWIEQIGVFPYIIHTATYGLYIFFKSSNLRIAEWCTAQYIASPDVFKFQPKTSTNRGGGSSPILMLLVVFQKSMKKSPFW